MFGKRLGGFLLGLLLGLIPLLNALICVVMSFVQKRKRLGIFFVALGMVSVVSLIMMEEVDKEKKALNVLWEPAFYHKLESADLKSESLFDGYRFEHDMFNVLDTATRELMQQHSELKDLFKTGTSGQLSIDNDVYAFFKSACRHINMSYWDRVKKETGNRGEKGARRVPFGETKEEQEYIRTQMSVFFKAYIDYKLKGRETAYNVLFGLGFLGSLIGSIALGWRAFAGEENRVTTNHVRFSWIAQPGDVPVTNVPVLIPDDNLMPDVNVNTADERELARLPGINQILAKGIISERRRNGYFFDIFDMGERMGFTEELVGSLMLITSFEVNGVNNRPVRTPEKREEQDKKDDDKGKDMGTGKGRVIEF